jgi:hypothetical protein
MGRRTVREEWVAAYAIDHRGHGKVGRGPLRGGRLARSPPRSALTDLDQFIDLIRQREPGVPIFFDLKNELFSRDPSVVAALDEDPLIVDMRYPTRTVAGHASEWVEPQTGEVLERSTPA